MNFTRLSRSCAGHDTGAEERAWAGSHKYSPVPITFSIVFPRSGAYWLPEVTVAYVLCCLTNDSRLSGGCTNHLHLYFTSRSPNLHLPDPGSIVTIDETQATAHHVYSESESIRQLFQASCRQTAGQEAALVQVAVFISALRAGGAAYTATAKRQPSSLTVANERHRHALRWSRTATLRRARRRSSP